MIVSFTYIYTKASQIWRAREKLWFGLFIILVSCFDEKEKKEKKPDKSLG